MIEALHLPKANLRLKRKGDEVFVWCIIRKKELLCTPEEWVRQHIIHDLIENKKIPIGLIASEFALNLLSWIGLMCLCKISQERPERCPAPEQSCRASRTTRLRT